MATTAANESRCGLFASEAIGFAKAAMYNDRQVICPLHAERRVRWRPRLRMHRSRGLCEESLRSGMLCAAMYNDCWSDVPWPSAMTTRAREIPRSDVPGPSTNDRRATGYAMRCHDNGRRVICPLREEEACAMAPAVANESRRGFCELRGSVGRRASPANDRGRMRECHLPTADSIG